MQSTGEVRNSDPRLGVEMQSTGEVRLWSVEMQLYGGARVGVWKCSCTGEAVFAKQEKGFHHYRTSSSFLAGDKGPLCLLLRTRSLCDLPPPYNLVCSCSTFCVFRLSFFSRRLCVRTLDHGAISFFSGRSFGLTEVRGSEEW